MSLPWTVQGRGGENGQAGSQSEEEGVVDMMDVGKQLGISLTELVKTYPDMSSLVSTWVQVVFP